MLNKIISSGSKVKIFTSLFEQLCKFCRRYNGRFINSQFISLSFSQTDLVKFKSKPHQMLVQLNQGIPKILPNAPLRIDTECSLKVLSNSRQLQARIIKGQKDLLHLQLWDQYSMIRRKKLDKHIKDVFNDEFYGKIRFSSSQNQIIFIAETSEDKFKTFWNDDQDEEGDGEDKKKEDEKQCEEKKESKKPKMKEANDKFTFVQSFGQTKSHIKRPLIGVYNISQDKLTFIKNLDPSITPQHPIFHPSNQKSILFSGQDTPHFKHGMTYCLNRPTYIYMIDDFEAYAKEETISQPINITKSSYLSFCPQFTPDGQWMTYAGRRNQFLSHITCFQLFKRPLETLKDESSSQTTVPLVNQRDKEKKFNGLLGYQSHLANRHLLSSNCHELFCAQFQDTEVIYVLNIENNQITRIPSGPNNDFGQVTILDVYKDKVLVSASSNNKLPSVWLLSNIFSKQNPTQLNPLSELKWAKITGCDDIINSKFKKESSQLFAQVSEFLENSLEIHKISYKQSEAKLLLPIQQKNEKVPLLVTIHGGPHTHVSDMFLVSRLTLLLKGYAILLPNYRGSTGFGLDFLEQLLGNVGDFDVQDCGQLTKATIQQFGQKRIDTSKIVAFGGSHGGFLTGWLVGHPEYSKLFSGGILWNPVINMSAMIGCTDIPEWIYAECLKRGQDWAPSLEQNSEFYKRSPISVVKNVKCPILMLMGAKDMRVPAASGFQFYNTLRARNVDVEMKWYPQDGHAIAGEETSINALMSMWIWLDDLTKGNDDKKIE